MKKRTAWIVSLLVAGAALWTADVSAQMPGMPPQGYGPMAGMPPSYGPPMGPGMAPGMGGGYAPPMYAVAPTGYMNPDSMAPAGMPMGQGYDDSYHDGYGYEGYGDCATCWGPGGRILNGARHVIRYMLPFDDGGCCAPHWFDAHVEYVNLRREDSLESIGLMSDTPLGPIVLSTGDIDFDRGHGFRATVTRQIGPGSNIELSYLGTHQFSGAASAESFNDSLFSIYSGFGSFPVAGQGFTETDRASYATVDYKSRIDNLELNFRQRWQGYSCKVQGSWLGGVRYFQLDEHFNFNTYAPFNDAESAHNVRTNNSLVGAQGGGDIWLCLIPGLSVGAEAKVGLYMNDAKQISTITGTTLELPFQERVASHEVSFVGELNVMALWRLSQSWTFRGAYNFIVVDGVALAPDNFNPTPPFLVPAFTNPPRTATLNTDGDIFLHGFSVGFEYMW